MYQLSCACSRLRRSIRAGRADVAACSSESLVHHRRLLHPLDWQRDREPPSHSGQRTGICATIIHCAQSPITLSPSRAIRSYKFAHVAPRRPPHPSRCVRQFRRSAEATDRNSTPQRHPPACAAAANLTRTSLTFADPVTHPATLLSPLSLSPARQTRRPSIRSPFTSAFTTSAIPMRVSRVEAE